MTKDEFNKWKNAYFTAFPDALAWLNKLPDPAATLGTWFKCLSRCNYLDIAVVTDKIVCGDLAPVEAYQREQTALHLRAYCGRIADERNRQQRMAAERTKHARGREGFRQDGPSMAGMFAKICEIRAEGEKLGYEGHELNEWASDRLGEWIEEQKGAIK